MTTKRRYGSSIAKNVGKLRTLTGRIKTPRKRKAAARRKK